MTCPGIDKNNVFIGIEKGQSISSISEILKENKIIKNEFAFKVIVRLKGADKKIMPGTHKFSQSMGTYGAVKELTRNVYGKSVNITIPEGWTIAQIQDKFNECGNTCPKLKNFKNKALFYRSVSFNHLYNESTEGYLFPDTYTITEEDDSSHVIEKMLEDFNRKIQANYMSDIIRCGKLYFNTDDYNEALYKVLTVASLIEREVKVDGEREIVASVIYNRLKKNMRLQIDATVNYVPGKSKTNKDKVIYKDLKNKNPYNTYKISGLPPGPICNPGEACIKAACNPAKTDYLYYVAKSDGSHVFSKDFQTHKDNIKKVRK